MTVRKFGTIKSLLHFDYPYFNEPNDGLGDEVSGETWTRIGNTKLAGNEIPYDIGGLPKFGYRCAYFPDTSSSIRGTNTNGIFNLSPSGEYEIEAFVRYINPEGFKFYNGHTYKVFNDTRYINWKQAKENCEALGGHLLTITSAEEQAFIETILEKNHVYWGGGKRNNNIWTWATGEEWNYENWASGQPNTSVGSGEYLWFVVNNNMLWSNSLGGYYYDYVCEWDYIHETDYPSQPQNIFSIGDLVLAVNSSQQLTLLGETSIATLISDIYDDNWKHILLRLKNGTAKVFLDGVEILSAALPTILTVPETITLGGFIGYMDEFCFRHSAGTGTPIVPIQPYSGKIKIDLLGDFGTGKNGDVTISSNSQINSYGMISTITDAKTFTISSWSNGTYTPAVGSEVMTHITAPQNTESANYPLVGLYAFRKIENLDGTNITLSNEISTKNGDDFTLSSSLLETYYVQVITVPNFASLTVNSRITITPLTWGTSTGGGIVAFRCTGDCTINGSILTHGYGAIRYDWHQMTHSKLIDRFLCSQGGGIFITCGGTFTASNDARLGASWSGLGDNSNGAAGYGGNAGGVTGKNAVGGGRGGEGGQECGVGGDGWGQYGGSISSSEGAGGGGGGGQGNSGGQGGTASQIGYDGHDADINGGMGDFWVRKSGSYTYSYRGGGGGGAPGGNGANGGGDKDTGSKYYNYYKTGGKAGASIILLCNLLNIIAATISTGGEKPQDGEQGQPGGGGTGFCYIACKEQVSNS